MDDDNGAFHRPEIDTPYEEELNDEDLPFITAPLRLAGESASSTAHQGIIRFIINLCKVSEAEEFEKKLKEFEDAKEIVENVKRTSAYSFRLYLLNASKLTPDDSDLTQAYVWIKRHANDVEHRLIKRSFDIINGEMNLVVVTHIFWPVNYLIILFFRKLSF